jgi:hypothetical protein
MPQANADAEIRALQVVIDALEPLDDDARSRVIDYTLKRLGIREISIASPLAAPPLEPSPAQPEPTRPTQVTDIRSLREAKKPSSAAVTGASADGSSPA